jgi:hypothetical protein
MKILETYVPVMAVSKNGQLYTDLVGAMLAIESGDNVEMVTWDGHSPLFYYRKTDGDIVYTNDVVLKYTVDGMPCTALDLIHTAKKIGYEGNDTAGAGMFLRKNGKSVGYNKNPTEKIRN